MKNSFDEIVFYFISLNTKGWGKWITYCLSLGINLPKYNDWNLKVLRVDIADKM